MRSRVFTYACRVGAYLILAGLLVLALESLR